jgi:Cft2 family RNA processing exonuclease
MQVTIILKVVQYDCYLLQRTRPQRVGEWIIVKGIAVCLHENDVVLGSLMGACEGEAGG